MPLYNHAVRTTPVTSLHTTVHFETFVCDSTLCLFLVSLSPETPTSRKVNTMVSNKHLFAHPAELTGPKLLKVAETRSNLQISNCVTEAATAAKPAVTNPTLLTGAAVASRILKALKIRASETGKTLREVRTDFAAVRKAHGIKVLVPGYIRVSAKAKAVAARTTSSVQVAAKSSDAIMESVEKEDVSGSDAEVGKLSGDDGE
jgi:peptidoglycan hydrolase-like amidase